MIVPKPKSPVATLLQGRLESDGFVGEQVMRGLHFFMQDVLKLRHYKIEVFPPEFLMNGTIVIRVYDNDMKEIFITVKPHLMDKLERFICLPDYLIMFAVE